MPCPFTGPKMFWYGLNFLRQTKNLFHIVAVTNILCQTKIWFAFSKIVFCAGTKLFEEALNAIKFSGWLKKFGPAQNILGPVKGQGIRILVAEVADFNLGLHALNFICTRSSLANLDIKLDYLPFFIFCTPKDVVSCCVILWKGII